MNAGMLKVMDVVVEEKKSRDGGAFGVGAGAGGGGDLVALASVLLSASRFSAESFKNDGNEALFPNEGAMLKNEEPAARPKLAPNVGSGVAPNVAVDPKRGISLGGADDFSSLSSLRSSSFSADFAIKITHTRSKSKVSLLCVCVYSVFASSNEGGYEFCANGHMVLCLTTVMWADIKQQIVLESEPYARHTAALIEELGTKTTTTC